MNDVPDTTALGDADLFGDHALAAYEDGASAQLLRRRNRHLGNLLLAERAAYYIQILYRMLLFRRDHELEPLYEDIYDAVKPAQDVLQDTGEYEHDQFRIDLNQLEDWEHVRCRIEIERLRGYRDTRRRKFRYTLTPECLHFLEWLEETAQTDLDRTEGDARDLLEDISTSLTVLDRLLGGFGTRRAKDDDPRRVLYRLDRLTTMTTEVNVRLADFNATLLSFVAHQYSIEEARSVLRELENFVEHFLRYIHELRGTITQKIEAMLESKAQEVLTSAAEVLEEERRRTPHLLRRTGEFRHPERIPFRLWEFFREDGRLDGLCQRIQDSATRVWRKLHAHLRELERRSTRIDDLRARTAELAALPPPLVPRQFMRELLAPAAMLADPNYWDDHERADPPTPRRRSAVERRQPMEALRSKQRRRGPVVSLEQARLEKLRVWIVATIGRSDDPEGTPLSSCAYRHPEDFRRVMDLTKAGILARGSRLRRVGYAMTPDPEHIGTIAIDEQSLSFTDMRLRRLSRDPDAENETHEQST